MSANSFEILMTIMMHISAVLFNFTHLTVYEEWKNSMKDDTANEI